jgi:hypothetical protein
MAERALLETSTRTWSDLFGNGKRYRVPRYQRDYAWGVDEWADLWHDIVALKNDAHYMGTVVLKADDDGRWTIIDGQQRMATLSILALAVISEIQTLASQGIAPAENMERVRILRDHLISSKDAASLKEQSRLTLNDSDNGFFQTRLVQLTAPPKPSRLKGSEKKLWEAFEYFQKRIRETFAEPRSGAALASFLQERVAQSLLFIEIKVQDELSAYTVFETLNARGLELTTTDLLKNYMFSLAAQSDSDLKLAQDQWHRLINRIDMPSFPDFLYHYIVSLGYETKKHRLFAQVRMLIRSREDVFRWLDQLEEAAETYLALSDPNDAMWVGDKVAEQCVRELTLFGVDQFKALVLAAQRIERRQLDLVKLLRLCVVLTMRATIIGHRNTADVLRAYQSAIKAVVEGRATSIKSIFVAVQSLYPSDEEFASQFETIQMPTSGARKKLVKYILCSLEPSFGGTEQDYETSPLTIEHILPENPNDDWASFSGEDRERFVYRLGNLTLLEPALNREGGSSSYERKRILYGRSASKMTAAIAAPEWSPVAVRERQADLARKAAQRWRLDF